MAKSKEQKRTEALARLTVRMEERRASGQQPTYDQRREHNALTYGSRKLTDIEKLFGAGDPVTGMIWADPLPFDFRPTPELDRIVDALKTSTDGFVEIKVSLETPDEYPYPTYLGSGTYLSQWVARHTPYVFHHSKHFNGSTITVVFSRPEYAPEYDEHDNLVKGYTKEMYDRRWSISHY